MNVYEIITLRLLHIGTGVFWAGSVIYLVAFINPAVGALGKEGGKFLQQLSRTNKLSIWTTVISTVNVLTGFRLLMIRSNYFKAEWFMTHEGLALTIGAVLAFGAYMIGLMSSGPALTRIGVIGDAVDKSGGTPNSEQAQEIEQKRLKVSKGAKVIAWHLVAVVVLMSIARYL